MTAYLIADIDVHDADAYSAYTAQTPALVQKHGGRFIARGGNSEAKEGSWHSRIAIIEFPSRDALKSFWDDPDYRKVVGIRHQHATSRLVAVDGV